MEKSFLSIYVCACVPWIDLPHGDSWQQLSTTWQCRPLISHTAFKSPRYASHDRKGQLWSQDKLKIVSIVSFKSCL